MGLKITQDNIRGLLLPALILFINFDCCKSQPLSLSKSLTLIQDDFHVLYDPEVVKYFRKSAPDSKIYEFYVNHQVNTFYYDMFITWNRKEGDAYHMTNMDGCDFLKHSGTYRIFNNFYQSILVNNTAYSCPITTGHYYLRPQLTIGVIPSIHPKGNFSLNVHIKTSVKSDAIILLDMNWKYRLVKAKKHR